MATVRVFCGACGGNFDLAASVAGLLRECPACHAPLKAAGAPAVSTAPPQIAQGGTTVIIQQDARSRGSPDNPMLTETERYHRRQNLYFDWTWRIRYCALIAF